MEGVVLSKRLQALAEMVTPGRCVVDVGCDHGFVSIYLVQKGISPKVLAMDVRTGPLSRAKEHIAQYGLEDYIETRLSDGLLEFRDGEASSLVCAGMGGRLMTRILTDSSEKAKGLEELILQPQSELPEFRRFLRMAGYELLDENIIYEEGKYYFLMKVRYAGVDGSMDANKIAGNDALENAVGVSESVQEALKMELLYEKYGELLLRRRIPLLKQYLQDSLQNLGEIAESLATNENERAQSRLMEIRQELVCLEQALALFA